MNTKQNLIQLCLLSVVMLPATLQAQFTFTTNNDAITITGYTGSDGTAVIPDTTNGYPVTAMADYAFYDISTLTNLTIPFSVTNIGVFEFQACSGLTNVTVDGANPNYASSGGVLFDKALATLLQCPGGLAGGYTIPNGVTRIAENAFAYCGRLSGATIPGSVTSIGAWAFYGSGLTNATIPGSITNIGSLAFAGGDRLTNIIVAEDNLNYASAGGVLFNKATNTLVQYPQGLAGSYTIPDNVTNIGDYAFIYSSLSDVTIPSSVIGIGYGSFWNENYLTTVAIPDSVASVGIDAFYACFGLKSVTLGSGVASIGYGAFGLCSALTNLTVAGANLNYASEGGVLFDNGMTTLLQCPEGLSSYAIPGGVTTIADNAFDSCSLTNVTIGDSVASIGESAFYGCSGLTSVTIPDNVGSIGWQAFYNCSGLTNVIIGSGVTYIGSHAFARCSGLTTVTIPASVASMGSYCFEDCATLTQVYFQGDAPPVDGWEAGSADDTVFSGETGTVYYTADTAGWDTTFGGWPTTVFVPFAYAYFTNDDNTITITGCTGLGGDNITIPDMIDGLVVTRLGDGAFQHNSSLTSITILAGVTSLGSSAFSDCNNLTEIHFLGNAPTADLTVFGGDNHAVVYYPPDATGWSSPFDGLLAGQLNPPSPAADFYYSTINGAIIITGYHGGGGDIGIPSTIAGLPVVGIGDGAFDYRSSLTSVTIPNSVTNIGNYPFYECYNLTSVTIGNGVTSIGYSAFDECGSLTSVMIGKSVTQIGDWAFEDCGSPLTIDCLGNAPQADGTVFYGDDPTTIYYLPDTTGWSSWHIAGLTTVLWTAPPLPSGPLTFSYITNGDNTVTITGCTGAGDVTIPDTINGLTVSSIADGAFQNNSSLTSITIPAGITSLGSSAFSGCTSLTGIYFLGDAPGADLTVFTGDNRATIYYLPGTMGWSSSFAGILAEVQNPVAPAGDFTWTTNDDTTTITITGYTGAGGDIGIPGMITDLPVVSIGDGAFEYNGNLTSVTIPNSVTNIGNDAFDYCYNLTRIMLGNNVTSIGNDAFEECYNLTNATIGNNVTNIGNYAFYDCSSLTAFTVAALNSHYSSVDGVLFNQGQTLLIQFPAGNPEGDYTMPDSVIGIEDYAFEYCTGLTNVTMGNDLQAIGMGAFWGCRGLTTAVIPNSVISIGYSAFNNCTSLTNVTIGSSVASIGESAFYDCSSLTTIAIPASVWSIGDYAFYGCSGLTAITVDPANLYYCSPNGVLFNHSQSTLIQYPEAKAGSYIIPNSVTSISYSAFQSCTNLTSLTIDDNLPTIGNFAFDGCSRLASVSIGNGVTSLGYYAFAGCTSLASATIPGHVTSIGSQAFYGDSSLTNVMIPASVTSIGNEAFFYCSSLIAVKVDAPNPVYGSLSGVLFDVGHATLIQFPCGVGGSYIVPGTVTNIANFAFFYSTNLTRVTIPDNVIYMGSGAFADCFGLTNATIGNGVTSISELAFANCGLTSVTIGSNVASIGDSAFGYCPLASVTIPNGVTSIGYQTFAGDSSLTNLIIGNSVTNIGQNAFSFCTRLASVTFPASLISLGDEAFYYCTNLSGAYFLGNAPDRDWFQFYYDNNATVYCLPETTGWTSWYGTRPVAPWNPRPQISLAGLDMQMNEFGFTLTGFSGQVIVVEACTDLANPVWCPVATNTISGDSASFSDSQFANYPSRYYRLRWP